MTTGQYTPETAPRNLNELQLMGPFMLKTLMQSTSKAMGIEWDDVKKQAFMRDPINKRAEDVLTLLQQFDSHGSAPAALATVPPALPPTQTLRREPVTSAKAPSVTNGTAGHAVMPDGMAVLAGMTEILGEVSASQKGVATMLGEINKSIKESQNVKKDVASLTAQMDQLFKLQHLTLGVIAQLAEQQLNAPFSDILNQVANDYGAIEPAVRGLIQGK